MSRRTDEEFKREVFVRYEKRKKSRLIQCAVTVTSAVLMVILLNVPLFNVSVGTGMQGVPKSMEVLNYTAGTSNMYLNADVISKAVDLLCMAGDTYGNTNTPGCKYKKRSIMDMIMDVLAGKPKGETVDSLPTTELQSPGATQYPGAATQFPSDTTQHVIIITVTWSDGTVREVELDLSNEHPEIREFLELLGEMNG